MSAPDWYRVKNALQMWQFNMNDPITAAYAKREILLGLGDTTYVADHLTSERLLFTLASIVLADKLPL